MNSVESLLASGMPIAKRLAANLDRRTPPSVRYDDLESAALEGLWQAAQKFEPSRGLTFETFAGHVIRGRMLDLLRAGDPLSRLKRTRAKRLTELKRTLSQTLGRQPTQDELAERTGLSLYALSGHDEDQLRELSLQHLLYENDHGTRETSLMDTIAVEEPDDGEQRFRELTRGLSDRSQAILWLYYWEDLSMGAIAEQLGLSESRISQALAGIYAQLRRRSA